MVITQSMEKALMLAARNGAVFAGGGNEVARGSCCSLSAITIKALAARGWVTLQISPDGGMMGRITEAGRAEARKAGHI